MQINFPGGWIMPALRPPHTVPPNDERKIQVRARTISHLRRLKERYLPELGDIIELPHTDYEYRAYCTHEQLAQALALMALDIDYVKSKSQAVEQYGDKQLYETNNAVWGTLYRKLSTRRIFDRPRWSNASPQRVTPASAAMAQLAATSRKPATESLFDDADLTDMVPPEWDDEVTVTRMPSGRIDHSQCDHGQGKAAKRRCARKNNKK